MFHVKHHIFFLSEEHTKMVLRALTAYAAEIRDTLRDEEFDTRGPDGEALRAEKAEVVALAEGFHKALQVGKEDSSSE